MSIGITVELKVEDIANSIKKLKKRIRRRFSSCYQEKVEKLREDCMK